MPPKNYKRSEETRRKMSEAKRGKNNPNYGKTHSEETRQKMRENHADFTGDKNPYRRAMEADPNKRVEAAERTRARWESLTEEERQEINYRNSLGQCNSEYSRNHTHNKNHVHGYYTSLKCNKTFFYRSSWELKVNHFLSEHPKVKSYDTEAFSIDYIDPNGNKRASRPDFFVELHDGRRLLLEVKPLALLKLNNNAEKLAGYAVWCQENNVTFTVLCEHHFLEGRSLVEIFREYLDGDSDYQPQEYHV